MVLEGMSVRSGADKLSEVLSLKNHSVERLEELSFFPKPSVSRVIADQVLDWSENLKLAIDDKVKPAETRSFSSLLELRMISLECAVSDIDYEKGEVEIIRTIGQRTREEEIQDFARSVGTMPDGDRIKTDQITKFFLVKSVSRVSEERGDDSFERALPVSLLRTVELSVSSLVSRTREGVGSMIGQMNEHMKRSMKSARSYHLNGLILRLARVRTRDGTLSTKVTWNMDQGKLFSIMLGLQGTQLFKDQQVVMGEDKSKFSIQINRGGFSTLLSILYLASCNFAGLTGIFPLVEEVMKLVSGSSSASDYVTGVLSKWRSLGEEAQRKVAAEIGREGLYTPAEDRGEKLDFGSLTTMEDWVDLAMTGDAKNANRILEVINEAAEQNLTEAEIMKQLANELRKGDEGPHAAQLSVSDDLGTLSDADLEEKDQSDDPMEWEHQWVEDSRNRPMDEWD
jgi:hypothetical protein